MKSKILQSLFAIAIILLLTYTVDFSVIFAGFAKLSGIKIFLLLMISILLVYLSALKWQLFVNALGERVSAIRLLIYYLIGYAVNLLGPSYIGGDAVRSYYVGKRVGQHEAVAATFLERLTGMAALLSLGLIFIWFIKVPFAITLTIFLVSSAFITLCILIANDKIIKLLLSHKSLNKIRPHIEKIQAAINLARKNHKLLFKSLLMSYFFHFFAVVNIYCTALCIDWQAPFWSLFTVLPLILIIGALPITPSGLGVQEGAYYYYLGLLGASPEQAVLIALVLRAKTYVLSLIGAVLFFLRSRTKLLG